MGCLAGMGFKTVSMALCEDSVSIDSPELQAEKKLAVILGTEGEGLGSRYYCRLRLYSTYSHGSSGGFSECGSC